MDTREPEPLQQLNRTYVRFRGRALSYFSGCDYFRLASHPRVARALKNALDRHGLNVAASRLTTGNHVLYRKLEAGLSDYFTAADALLVPTGYVANLVVAEALAGRFSHALIDQRAHLSLQAAAQLLNCPVVQFAHRDSLDLQRNLHRCGPGARIIVLTDGMFARDGSVAPLREYSDALPSDAVLLVDDAHGAGVLGASGRGAPEYCGLDRKRLIQTLTLSKAFGVYGGVVLGSCKLRRSILQRSHLFMGSTPFPLPLAAAALESLCVLRKNGAALRRRLAANTNLIRTRLRAFGFTVADNPGPIILLAPEDSHQLSRIKRVLLRAGIFPPLVKYPGGPADGYFRFVISSEHTPQQLETVLRALQQVLHSERPPA